MYLYPCLRSQIASLRVNSGRKQSQACPDASGGDLELTYVWQVYHRIVAIFHYFCRLHSASDYHWY